MNANDKTFKALCIAGFAGFLGISLQILLIQESLAAQRSNELSIAVFLGIWLLLTGAGSLTGYQLPLKPALESVLPAAMAMLLPVTLAAFRITPALLKSTPGEMSGFSEFIMIPLLTMIPFCLLNGMLFAFPVKMIRQTGTTQTSYVFAAESIGALCGAVVIRSVHSFSWSTFELAGYCLIAASPLLAVILISGISRHKFESVARIVILAFVPVAGLSLILTGSDIARRLDSLYWPGQTIEDAFDSVYGRWHLVSYDGRPNLYNNHSLVAHGGITRTDEETISIALALHPKPVDVLFLDGAWNSMSSISSQIVTKDVEVVTIDTTPLRRFSREQLRQIMPDVDLNRMNIRRQDPGKAIAQAGDSTCDVIISNAPVPLSLNASRFYSSDFFLQIRRVLRPDGVFAMTVSGSENLMSPEQTRYVGIVFRSMFQAFDRDELTIVPGDMIRVFARPGKTKPLTSDEILVRIRQAGIVNRYPSDGYLPYIMHPEALRLFWQYLDQEESTDISTASRPLVFPAFLNLWHSQWRPGKFTPFQCSSRVSIGMVGSILAVVAGFTIGFPARKKQVFFAVGVTGSTCMIAQIMLLFLLQLKTGALYHEAGLLVGLFSLGLATGSLLFSQPERPGRNRIAILQLGLGILMTVLCLITWFTAIPFVSLLFLAAFLSGFLGGGQFVLGAGEFPGSVPALYLTDLAGASLSALVISSILLPVAGIPLTGLLFGMLSLISGTFLLRRTTGNA